MRKIIGLFFTLMICIPIFGFSEVRFFKQDFINKNFSGRGVDCMFFADTLDEALEVFGLSSEDFVLYKYEFDETEDNRILGVSYWDTTCTIEFTNNGIRYHFHYIPNEEQIQSWVDKLKNDVDSSRNQEN
jgi:hypothetical protein